MKRKATTSGSAVERAPDYARVRRLGVAKLARLVYRLAGQAEVGDRGWAFPTGTPSAAVPRTSNLAPLLRRVVLVGEPALRLRFDLEGVGLGA